MMKRGEGKQFVFIYYLIFVNALALIFTKQT